MPDIKWKIPLPLLKCGIEDDSGVLHESSPTMVLSIQYLTAQDSGQEKCLAAAGSLMATLAAKVNSKNKEELGHSHCSAELGHPARHDLPLAASTGGPFRETKHRRLWHGVFSVEPGKT